MRNNWGWLVVVSLLTVGLSGCFGGDEPVQDDQEHGDDTGDGNMTAENITAVIAVTINGTAANPINGSIATFVGTNVTFDGSGSNGTNLSYAWAFDDDTSGTNVTEVHAFAAPGLFNVTLSVSQGNTTAQASVMLNVSVSGPQTGDLVWTDKKAFTGNLPVGNPNAAAQADVDYRDHPIKILAAAPDGTPALAKKVKIVLDGSGATAQDMYLYWRKGTTNLASATGAGLDKTLVYEGDMAAGDYVCRVRFAVGAQASYKVNVDVDYFAT